MPPRLLVALCLASALAAGDGTARLRDAKTGKEGRRLDVPAPGEELAADVTVLKKAGVAADEPGLLEFFKRQTASDGQRRAIGELIQQLGDDTFRVREKAARALKALGPAARAALQQAQHHKDAEVATRAKRCLKDIANGNH